CRPHCSQDGCTRIRREDLNYHRPLVCHPRSPSGPNLRLPGGISRIVSTAGRRVLVQAVFDAPEGRRTGKSSTCLNAVIVHVRTGPEEWERNGGRLSLPSRRTWAASPENKSNGLTP